MNGNCCVELAFQFAFHVYSSVVYIPSSSIFCESVCFFVVSSLCSEACTRINSFSKDPWKKKENLYSTCNVMSLFHLLQESTRKLAANISVQSQCYKLARRELASGFCDEWKRGLRYYFTLMLLYNIVLKITRCRVNSEG